MILTRPAWVEVNLDTLAKNINTIKEQVTEGTTIISVVKSNAYGYGAVKVVETLIEEGINNFAVATLSEAISLRNHFKDIEILVLGYTPVYLIEESIKNNITMTIYSLDMAKEINEIAKKLKRVAKINVAIDSGMNRIGFKVNKKSAVEICKITKLKNTKIEGMFTHFAVADENADYTEFQFNNYMDMVIMLKELNVDIPLKHVNNSQGIINYREYDLDAVRPGLVQYGSTEGVESKYEGFEVEYIGELKAQIANLKFIEKGEKVSYGLTFEAERKTKVATLPLGYSDGVLRQLSGKIDVLVSGKRCKQIGRICMDQMMIDVSDVDCKIGDEVVLIGKQEGEEIPILEIAKKADEIATSFSCHFSERLPRVYIKNGEVESIYDGVLNR